MRTSEQDLEIGRIMTEHEITDIDIQNGLEDGALLVLPPNSKPIILDRWGGRHDFYQDSL